MNSPLVSVIMPVYNCELYLKDAIKSILDQTYTNFELLILSAHQTNAASLEIINSFSDPRIRHIRREPGDILPKALNLGLNQAKGTYIARMDADDISLPQRFSSQVAFLEGNPNIGIVGSFAQTFGDTHSLVIKHPTEPAFIKANLLFRTSLVHPTVMMRKSILDQFQLRYNENLKRSEDVDMWVRSSMATNLATIPKVLLNYRRHSTQATNNSGEDRADDSLPTRINQLKILGFVPEQHEIVLHQALRAFKPAVTLPDLASYEAWLQRIKEHNDVKEIYDASALHAVLADQWLTISKVSRKNLGISAAFMCIGSPLILGLPISVRSIGRVIKLLFNL